MPKRKPEERSHGRAADQVQISLALPDELLNWIDEKAAEEHRNRSSMIRKILLDEQRALEAGDSKPQ